MKSTLLPAALAGAVSGGLVFAALSFTASSKDARSAESDVVAAERRDVSDSSAKIVGEQVAVLETEVARLRDALTELQGQSSLGVVAARESVGDDPTLLSAEELENLKQLASVAADAPGLDALGNPIEYSNVKTVLEDIRAEEEAERDLRRAERELERIEADVERWTEDLGLDGYQSGEMRNALISSSEKRNALFTAARENDDWMGMREGMMTLREETQAELELFLTPDQLEQYNDRNRGFGGGRGPGGGGRGGRGE